MTHELKIKKEYFEEILLNNKNFEIRFNDRDFQIGDDVLLREISDSGAIYTGRNLAIRITYITDYEQKEGYVVFGFKIR
jgi:ASC-1-like (ASCH) protein